MIYLAVTSAAVADFPVEVTSLKGGHNGLPCLFDASIIGVHVHLVKHYFSMEIAALLCVADSLSEREKQVAHRT